MISSLMITRFWMVKGKVPLSDVNQVSCSFFLPWTKILLRASVLPKYGRVRFARVCVCVYTHTHLFVCSRENAIIWGLILLLTMNLAAQFLAYPFWGPLLLRSCLFVCLLRSSQTARQVFDFESWPENIHGRGLAELAFWGPCYF